MPLLPHNRQVLERWLNKLEPEAPGILKDLVIAVINLDEALRVLERRTTGRS